MEPRPIQVSLQRLVDELPLPAPVRAGDAAADLPAAAGVTIEPGERALVPTGFAIAVPDDCCALVLPRSGLALHHGVTVVNGPGLIDPGYRGEVKVILGNTGSEPFTIERGDRIAQLLVLALPSVRWVETDELPPAPDDRGAAGFGSSGSGPPS